MSVEGSFDGGEGVGPDNGVDADGWAFAEDFGELFVGLGFGVLFHREAEAVVGAAEDAVALEAEDEEIDGRCFEVVVGEASLGFGGEFFDGLRDVAPCDDLMRLGEHRADVGEKTGGRGIGGAAVEDDEAGGVEMVLGGGGGEGGGDQAEGGVFALADDEHIGAALSSEDGGGGIFDGDRFAEPKVGGDGGFGRGGLREGFG